MNSTCSQWPSTILVFICDPGLLIINSSRLILVVATKIIFVDIMHRIYHAINKSNSQISFDIN